MTIQGERGYSGLCSPWFKFCTGFFHIKRDHHGPLCLIFLLEVI